jgi:hypothetical protein
LDQGIGTPYSRGTFCKVIHADLAFVYVLPQLRTEGFSVSQGRHPAGDVLHLIDRDTERRRNLGVRPLRIPQRQADQAIPAGQAVLAKHGEHLHAHVR